jgi:hypothetical protein
MDVDPMEDLHSRVWISTRACRFSGTQRPPFCLTSLDNLERGRGVRWRIFHVIDCDERSGTIRIQTFDGDLDEIEEEFWRALPLEPVEPPEDWTGPLDNVEADDLDQFVAQGYTQPIEPADYREPWEALLAEEEMGADVVELGTPERETVDGPRMKRSFGPANRPLKTAPPRPGV